MKLQSKKGATFIEYALLAGLVAIVVAVAALFFGDEIKGLFAETGQKTHTVKESITGATLAPNVEAITPTSGGGTGGGTQK